jgi:hypothetical protein
MNKPKPKTAVLNPKPIPENESMPKAPMPVNVDVAWDIVDPKAVEWIINESCTLIQNISKETEEAIRDTLERGFTGGKSLQWMSTQIREILGKIEQNLGLNRRQAAAFDHYRDDLMKRGISGRKFDNALERYRRDLIKQRADMIASTETARAANEGWRLQMKNALKEGLIDPTVWECSWMAAYDEKVCPDCMGMQGKRRPIDGVYTEGAAAGTDGPILHPGCRCNEGTKRISTRQERAGEDRSNVTPEMLEREKRIPPAFREQIKVVVDAFMPVSPREFP